MSIVKYVHDWNNLFQRQTCLRTCIYLIKVVYLARSESTNSRFPFSQSSQHSER